VDLCGRLWTLMESRAFDYGPCGRLWTPVDSAWRSTDQEVGGSGPSGRATETPGRAGVSSRAGVVFMEAIGLLLPDFYRAVD
jgi:hypothetical protein